MERTSNDFGAEPDTEFLASQMQSSGLNFVALLGLLRDTLADLEREAISLERLVKRQDELFRQAGLD